MEGTMMKMMMVEMVLSTTLSVAAMAMSFEHLTIDTSVKDLNLSGNASIANDGVYLTQSRIGSNLTYSFGRAFYNQAVPLWTRTTNENVILASFNTSFSAQITNTSGRRLGDGIAFLMAGSPSPAPPNSVGGLLALYDSTTNNKSSSQLIAIEFDSFPNPEYNDPDGNHVGIDINSINSTRTASLSLAGINLSSGAAQFTCWVEYDSFTKNLSIYATKELISTRTKPPRTPLVLSYTIDLSQFLPQNMYVGLSASTGNNTEIHRIISWDFNSTPFPPKGWISVAKIVAIAVASGLMVFLILPLILCLARRRRKLQRKRKQLLGEIDLSDYTGPRNFTFKELSDATRKFSRENLLGRGGFGSVYKGILRKSWIPIAVKCIEKSSNQGEKEFLAEVSIISRIRHKNLLQLQGWCLTHAKEGQMLLVYEYMPNGSLDKFIYPSVSDHSRGLDWSIRYKIISGLAAALLYLHEEWEKQVIHRDVKSSNVLLDQDFNPRLGDFGLARLVDHDMAIDTTRVAGTLGFLAPEVLDTGKATSASDVFSFGVVALEVVCGRRSLNYSSTYSEVRLVDWVWTLHSEGRIIDAVDSRLKSEQVTEIEGNEEEMARVLKWGLACSHPDPSCRPTMRQVHDSLFNHASHPHIPSSKPLIASAGSSNSTSVTFPPSTSKDASQPSLTISLSDSTPSTSNL